MVNMSRQFVVLEVGAASGDVSVFGIKHPQLQSTPKKENYCFRPPSVLVQP